MSNATELRAKLTDKVKAMPTEMLMQALDELDTKPNRDAAESMVIVELSVECAQRFRDMAREHSTESLVKDLREEWIANDYATMPATKRKAYWATLEVLEERFPTAAEQANAWLDSLTSEQMESCGGSGWDNYFLALITEEA